MTILPTHTASRIRNRSMGILHLIAAEESCEVYDILALIFPSQPEPTSLRTAADTPSAQAAGDATDGPRGLPSLAEPSVARIPDAPKPFPAASGLVVQPMEAKTSDQGPLSSEPGGVQDLCESTPPTPSPANKPKTRTQGRADQVVATIKEHPDWPDTIIGEHLGVAHGYVRRVAARAKLTLASRITWQKAQQAQTIEALKAAPAQPQEPVERADPPTPRAKAPKLPAANSGSSDELDQRLIALHLAEPTLIRPMLADRLGVKPGQVNAAVARLSLNVPHVRASNDAPFVPEVIPPATPQQPVGSPIKVQATLGQRVRALHHQHPNWTGRMIANELGASVPSVQTMLLGIKGEQKAGAAPEFAGKAELQEHYAEVGKRLGKAS